MSADVTNSLMNPTGSSNLDYTTDETKLWLYKSVCETTPESLFYGGPNCVLGLSISNDYPVKKAIVNLPI